MITILLKPYSDKEVCLLPRLVHYSENSTGRTFRFVLAMDNFKENLEVELLKDCFYCK